MGLCHHPLVDPVCALSLMRSACVVLLETGPGGLRLTNASIPMDSIQAIELAVSGVWLKEAAALVESRSR